MSNNVIPLRGGSMPSVFASRTDLPNMASAAQQGLQAAFTVVGYKGRNWRLKYRGEDELLKDGRGVPFQSIEVVIVGISPAISKIWYDKRFAEGDNAAPDCFSVNGVEPDAASPKKQCNTCAACPQNVWGSRITEAGKKAKSCQDARRIAVVPLGDIHNESYGGPMLLRVPPMSLANLAKYGSELSRYGAQPFMVATTLSFDYNVAYPLIEFSAQGWLNEEQGKAVAEVMEDPLIERLLSVEVVEVTADDEGNKQAESPLAGGKPPSSLAAAPAEPAPKTGPFGGGAAEPVSAEPAPAQPAPTFGTPKVATAPKAAAPAPVQGTRKASAFSSPAEQPPAEPAREASPVVVQEAPSDMDAAIDDLLAS